MERAEGKQRFTKEKLARVGYPLCALLLVIFLVLAYRSFQIPLVKETQTEDNLISQTSQFTVAAQVLPSALHPQGGITTEAPFFPKITQELEVTISSIVQADKPVAVEGEQSVVLTLIAEGLWERDFPLGETKAISNKGVNNRVINSTYAVNLAEIMAYIDEVEKEISVMPNQYNLKLKPLMEGTISYDNQQFPLDAQPELLFELKRVLEVTGETEYSVEYPVVKTHFNPQYYSLWGWIVPLQQVRIATSIVALLLLAVLIQGLVKFLRSRKQSVTEANRIDKKYRGRLIPVKNSPLLDDKLIVSLDSIKSLQQVADEKELPLLRLEESKYTVTYAVADGEYIFYYQASKLAGRPSSRARVTPARSELGNDS